MTPWNKCVNVPVMHVHVFSTTNMFPMKSPLLIKFNYMFVQKMSKPAHENSGNILNRPSVAGPVLQTAL